MTDQLKAGYYVLEMSCGTRIIKKVWPVINASGKVCGHRIASVDGPIDLAKSNYKVIRRVPDEILEGDE